MKSIGTFLTLLVMALLGLQPAAQAQLNCLPPTSVSVSSTGSPGNNTAVVSFTPSATAVSYTVRYFWIGDSTAAGMMSVNTTTSPVTLTGLRTGTGAYYRVKVVSNCAGGFTTASSWTTFLVGGSGGPGPGGTCAAPTNVVASPSGAGAVSLNFTPVAGAASYTIQYYPAFDSTQVQTLTTAGAPVLIGNSSLPGVRYIIRIVTNCGGGSTSTPVTVSGTSGGTPACSAPAGLAIVATTNVTASVGFTYIPGVQSYTIRYAPLGANPALGASMTVNSSPALLTGLLPNTAYTVTIQSNCGGGVLSATASTTFTTQPNSAGCGAVTNITVTAASDSSAIVSFTPGAGNTSFQVVYFVTGDSSRTLRVLSAAASPVTLRRLVPGRIYTIRVTSVCGTGGSVSYTSGAPVVFTMRSALASRSALGAGLVSVFPNPAHHTASLVLPAVAGAAQAQLTLLNALGQAVRSQTLSLLKAGETRAQLDLADVPPGLYTLRVAAGGQTATQRLAVE